MTMMKRIGMNAVRRSDSQRGRWALPGLLLALAAQTAGAEPTLPVSADALPARVEQVRKRFDVPGIAIAIVKDGRVVLEQGFGLREIGKPDPVDAHTLFAIASNTKAFTAASLAMLADAQKLSLDDRVIEHLPWFAMSDAYVTREMRVRDLLVHRSGLGLGAGDMLFWPATTYTTEEVVRRLRDVPLKTSFRSAYAYDNILYAVAGLVIEQASGQRYADFVRERIFAPLGMSETRINSESLAGAADIAVGHAKFDFTALKPVPAMSWSNNSAAGGIYSNVHDLTRWVRMQLDGGAMAQAADGKEQRLFSAERQREMWSLITPIPIAKPIVPELAPTMPNFFGYGEGWFVGDYRGRKLVWHTGGWPGMVSRITLVPEEKLGIIVLTNQEVGAAYSALTYGILDDYLLAADQPHPDWVAAYAAAVEKTQSRADEGWQKHVAARDATSKPSLALEKYAGTYRDVWYGDIVIAQERGKLVMRFSRTAQLVGDLEPWQHDTFFVRWRDRSLNADALLTFALTPDAGIREARMEAASSLTDFSFDFQDLRLLPVSDAH